MKNRFSRKNAFQCWKSIFLWFGGLLVLRSAQEFFSVAKKIDFSKKKFFFFLEKKSIFFGAEKNSWPDLSTGRPLNHQKIDFFVFWPMINLQIYIFRPFLQTIFPHWGGWWPKGLWWARGSPQRALREPSESPQRALREPSESPQRASQKIPLCPMGGKKSRISKLFKFVPDHF